MNLAALCIALGGGLLVLRLNRFGRSPGPGSERRGFYTAVLVPSTLRSIWRAVYGEGRGPIGDQLASEEPTLDDLPTLRWQMLFAGYRNRDLAWLRRRQLMVAVTVLWIGLCTVLALDLPLVLAVLLVPLALVLGVAGVHLEVRRAIGDRQRDMRAKCVPWLDGLAAFLSASTSLIESLRLMAVNDESDLAYETRVMLAKMGSGVRPDRAFATFAVRCNTEEIAMAVTRMTMQQATGQGSLHVTLHALADSLRKRIVTQRTAERKSLVLRSYVELTITAVPLVLVATAAPSLYQTLHLLPS